MGISNKDFLKIHMHGMEAFLGFFFIHVDGFLCAGRREEEGKEKKGREKRREEKEEEKGSRPIKNLQNYQTMMGRVVEAK